jgi:hypothetical protein
VPLDILRTSPTGVWLVLEPTVYRMLAKALCSKLYQLGSAVNMKECSVDLRYLMIALIRPGNPSSRLRFLQFPCWHGRAVGLL